MPNASWGCTNSRSATTSGWSGSCTSTPSTPGKRATTSRFGTSAAGSRPGEPARAGPIAGGPLGRSTARLHRGLCRRRRHPGARHGPGRTQRASPWAVGGRGDVPRHLHRRPGLGDRGRARRRDDPGHLGDGLHRPQARGCGLPDLPRDHDASGARRYRGAGVNGGPSLPWHRAWLQGALSALLNPKLGVFFLTLLPQFISPGDPPALRALQLAVVFEVIGLAWLLIYTGMLGALGTALGRPGPRRFMRWVTGTVLVASGLAWRSSGRSPGSVQLRLPVVRHVTGRARCGLVQRVGIGRRQGWPLPVLVDGVAPEPVLVRLEALDERMAGVPRVLARMLGRR